MDTYTIHFGLAMLAAGFWVPAGIWLMLNRHALTVLASTGPRRSTAPTVSIVIPARNEERNLEQALESVLALDYPDLEIIVVNDRSTDGTGEILEKMAKQDARLTVVTMASLPADWIGKPYALHRGALEAQGEFILFTDADIVFHPFALGKAMAHVQAHRFDHVTLIPEGTMPGFFLRTLAATFGIFMFLLFKPWKARNPRSRCYMGIGAFNLIRTSAYRAMDGHQPVALRPDDDLKFAKLVKDHGYRQDVLNGEGDGRGGMVPVGRGTHRRPHEKYVCGNGVQRLVGDRGDACRPAHARLAVDRGVGGRWMAPSLVCRDRGHDDRQLWRSLWPRSG